MLSNKSVFFLLFLSCNDPVHFRSAVTEQSPFKTLCCQLIQIVFSDQDLFLISGSCFFQFACFIGQEGRTIKVSADF